MAYKIFIIMGCTGLLRTKPSSSVGSSRGGSRGGGGPFGGPFGGPPNFIKREKNVACMRAKTLYFTNF